MSKNRKIYVKVLWDIGFPILITRKFENLLFVQNMPKNKYKLKFVPICSLRKYHLCCTVVRGVKMNASWINIRVGKSYITELRNFSNVSCIPVSLCKTVAWWICAQSTLGSLFSTRLCIHRTYRMYSIHLLSATYNHVHVTNGFNTLRPEQKWSTVCRRHYELPSNL